MSSPQNTPLEKFRVAIGDSPSYMVEQFTLLHSNYLDDTRPDAAELYRTKIAAIQDLCTTALAHIEKKGGKRSSLRPSLRQAKTKKKRRNNR